METYEIRAAPQPEYLNELSLCFLQSRFPIDSFSAHISFFNGFDSKPVAMNGR